MCKTEQPARQQFEFVVLHSSGTSKNTGSLADCHAKLGEFAGKNDLNLHIHNGLWDSSSYSVAYKGDEPLFHVQAFVRLPR